MPAKKMMTVEIAAMRSEFHKGYQSIGDPPMQPPAAAISKRAILSVRMAPLDPPETQGALPMTPELRNSAYLLGIVCGRLSSGTIWRASLSARPLLLRRYNYKSDQKLRGAEADGLEYGHSGIGLEIGEEGARGLPPCRP